MNAESNQHVVLEPRTAGLERDRGTGHDAPLETEQYRYLAEALPDIVWTAGPDGSIEYYNRRWFEYTGMTFEETHGGGWSAVLHPDDVAPCLEGWTNAVKHDRPYEAEYRFKRGRDETYRWHLCRATAIRDATGSIEKWFGTCTDIDDQKRAAAERLAEQVRVIETLAREVGARQRVEAALRASDDRFRQVEQHAPIGLAVVALDGTFTRANPALCALTGYSERELLSKTSQSLAHPDDRKTYFAFVKQMLDGSISSYQMEKRYFHKDGHIVWILCSGSLVRDDSGQPLYFITQLQDISARRSAEQAVEAAQRTALAATEAKSRFLATMSHEIRTPMNGIVGMTELLSLSPLSTEQSEYVKVIRDSGRSLLRVLNDILDYSKIEAGKLELETADFDLASQIRSVVSLLGPQFRTKGVSLTTHVDRDVPPTLKGDAGRLRQILINLLGNALKFTPAEGSVRVLVAGDKRDGAAIPVRFTIADTGIGIPSDARDRLFLPFSQVDGTTTRKYGGTGLGLSICKQLVDLMGGDIGVTSTVGSGSSFWFTIPFLQGSKVARPLDAPARDAGERRATVRPRTEKLLIAEDNEVNMLLAIRQFKRLGFDVTVVPNGREAVKAVEHGHFNLVFMDCHMPEMDGFEATRAIRKLPSDTEGRVPIVAMTADAQAEDREACLAAGMDDYVSKPVSLADLRTLVARWLPAMTDDSSGNVRARE